MERKRGLDKLTIGPCGPDGFEGHGTMAKKIH